MSEPLSDERLEAIVQSAQYCGYGTLCDHVNELAAEVRRLRAAVEQQSKGLSRPCGKHQHQLCHDSADCACTCHIAVEQARAEQRQLSHADWCLLSQAWNSWASLREEYGVRINDWLKQNIAAAIRAAPQQTTNPKGDS